MLLDVNNMRTFSTNAEVKDFLKLDFGSPGSGIYHKKGKEFCVWFPNISEIDSDGKYTEKNSCTNVLTDNGTKIIYENNGPHDKDTNLGINLVFGRYRNGNKLTIRFLGVFKQDPSLSEYSGNKGKYVFKRLSDKVELIGTPPQSLKFDSSEDVDFKDYSEEALQIDNKINELGLEGKERVALVRQRVNQGIFREMLLEKQTKCVLCGMACHELLTASHIKPWSKSNPKEKLDVYNGLMLCPNHDELFDKGFITFDDDGLLTISNKLSIEDRILLGIVFPNEKRLLELPEKTIKYMKYHRENVFIG